MDVENFNDDDDDNSVDNASEISESIKAMDEIEINEALKLPPELLAVTSLAARRQLLHAKASMTEIEWEQDIEKRMEEVQKGLDLKRLINMQSAAKGGMVAKGKKAASSAKKTKRRKFSAIRDDDDDDDDDDDGEEEEESEDEVEDGEELDARSDGSDDLFDSDEEEFISRKFEGSKTSKKAKPALKKAKKTKLSSLSDDDEAAEDDMQQDEGDAADDAQSKDEEIDLSPPASFKDCLKLQLRRDLLMKWVSEPYFEEAVLHNFVRLSMGEQNGINVYAMAEIVAVKGGFKHYKVDNKTTDVRLDLAIGASIRRFRISLISNSRITEHEFKLYVARVEASPKGRLLTEKEAATKRKQLVEATQYHKYTNAEINQMILKSRGVNKAVTTNQATALESLNKRLSQAYQDQNDAEIATLSKAKEKLEAQIQKEKALVERVAGAQVSLNRRNKERNFQKDFQAGIRRADESSSNQNKASAQDPFIRRETRPQNIWNTGAKLEVERQRNLIKAKLKKLEDEKLLDSQEAKALNEELRALDESDTTKKTASVTLPEASAGKVQETEEWKSGVLSIEEVRNLLFIHSLVMTFVQDILY